MEPGGVVGIPAPVLHEGGIEVGDTVLVHVEDGRIVVDELLAERRTEAGRDRAG